MNIKVINAKGFLSLINQHHITELSKKFIDSMADIFIKQYHIESFLKHFRLIRIYDGENCNYLKEIISKDSIAIRRTTIIEFFKYYFKCIKRDLSKISSIKIFFNSNNNASLYNNEEFLDIRSIERRNKYALFGIDLYDDEQLKEAIYFNIMAPYYYQYALVLRDISLINKIIIMEIDQYDGTKYRCINKQFKRNAPINVIPEGIRTKEDINEALIELKYYNDINITPKHMITIYNPGTDKEEVSFIGEKKEDIKPWP